MRAFSFGGEKVAGKEFLIGFVVSGVLASSFGKTIGTAGKAVKNFDDKIKALNTQASKTGKLIKLRETTQSLSKEFFKQKATLANLNQAVAATKNPSEVMLKAQAKAARQFTATERKMEREKATLRSLTKELNAAGQSTAILEKRQKALQKSTEKLYKSKAKRQTIERTSSDAFAVASATGAGLLTMFASGAQFEKSMSGLLAASGADSAAMKRAEAQALRLGESTKFTGAQALQGMIALNKSGYSIDEAIAAVGPSLHLAAAEGMALERAADIVSDVLNQYGMSAEQAAYGADFLAKASNLSSTNVEGMYNAFKYAGPAAKRYQVSLEETGAAMTVLSGRGIKGEAGGTAVRAVMDNLYSPVNDARKVIKALGIEVYDAKGKMLPFTKVLQNAHKAMAGLDPERKNAAMMKIFGTTASGVAEILMEASNGPMKEFAEQLRQCSGEAGRIAKVQEDNLIGDLTVLASKFSSVAIAIYTGVAPALRWLTQAGTGILSAVHDFIKANPVLAKTLTYVASAIAVVAAAILPLKLAAAAASFAFALLTTPASLVAMGIMAVVAAGVLLYKNWDTIKQKAAELWEFVSGIFTKIGNKISETWGKAKAFFGFGLKSTTVDVMTQQGNASAQIPAMASGGIVTSPTLALVGEGRESEAVLPLSKLGNMLGSRSSNSNVVVNLSVNVSGSSHDAYADIKRGISEGTANLKRELERLLNDQRRLSFV